MISADPAKAADELDKWAAGLEQKARSYAQLQQRMDATSATESTPDGAIRVTVDVHGVPTAIDFSERALDLEPARLSAAVMGCLRRAQARMRAQVEELVAATVPADDEPARNIVSQYQQRFPDVDGDAATARDADEDRIGVLEEDESTPPRPPRRSSVDRPADDWDPGSPLR